MSGEPFVSCLCVTHDRVHLLRRAVACFALQTHANRELVLLHEDGDAATRAYVASLGNPMIRTVEVPASPRLPVGTKRNLLVEAARGKYIANWDDDDWYGPARLADQLRTIESSGLPACALQFEVVYDALNHRAFLSQDRRWENSIVALRTAMPRYGDVQIAEDIPCIEQLVASKSLAALASPHLYVYVYHGANTCSPMHFASNIFTRSVPLDAAAAARIGALLEAPGGPPLTLAEVLAGRA